LEANCGRPWSKVRGELFARFDIRTTPGRHILFDHLLREVEEQDIWRRPRFAVDAHGILRRARSRARVRQQWFNDWPLRRWIGDRRITRVEDRFQWWTPAKRDTDRRGQPLIRWRAVGLLSEDEERYLRSVPAEVLA